MTSAWKVKRIDFGDCGRGIAGRQLPFRVAGLRTLGSHHEVDLPIKDLEKPEHLVN